MLINKNSTKVTFFLTFNNKIHNFLLNQHEILPKILKISSKTQYFALKRVKVSNAVLYIIFENVVFLRSTFYFNDKEY